MIDRGNVLPLTRQASLLRLSRNSVYSMPRPVPPARLAIMHRIDALHLEHSFVGSRMLRDLLRAAGTIVGCLAVATLMRRMYRGAVSAAQLLQTRAWTQVLPVSAAQPGGGPAEPSLGDGHYLHPDGAGLCISCGGGGLVQPAGPGLAAVDYAGNGSLP